MMPSRKRHRLSVDSRIYRAIRRHVRSPKDLREWVDNAMQEALQEDREDEKAFRERTKQASIPYEVVRRRLKRDGLL